MQNIPIFTGVHGMATLILKEIPVSGYSYVLVRSVWKDNLPGLLEEAAAFCREAGAKAVFASYECYDLPARHVHDVLEFTMDSRRLPEVAPVPLTPISKENGRDYLAVYNRCFARMPGHASYDEKDLSRLLEQGGAFLVYRGGTPAAVVELGENSLEGIGVLPEFKGLGYPLAVTALKRLPEPTLFLKVVSTNHRAIRLYQRIGFAETKVVSRWWEL